YRRMDLRGNETVVHGIRVSSLDRTALDIARFYGFEEGLVAVDDVRARNVGQFWINETLGAMGRVKGVAAARRAVAESVNCSESPWESYARALVLAADYPELRWVKAQYVIENYRADLVINGWLVIEIDGNVKYRHEVDEVIRAEHRRQQAILNKGYIVLRFSPEQLSSRPDYFQETVGKHLARGSQL
ncbi:MAG TPA: endonuclease domain-containing protein, partial [Candidatus Corynebacterium faecipullorum]|nr:endonuclease domain-containing protein [Candidatus Corynebacterium faecipullorum]